MRPITDAQKKTLRKELEVLGAFDGSEERMWCADVRCAPILSFPRFAGAGTC